MWGRALGAGGDVNGDGIADLVIGAAGANKRLHLAGRRWLGSIRRPAACGSERCHGLRPGRCHGRRRAGRQPHARRSERRWSGRSHGRAPAPSRPVFGLYGRSDGGSVTSHAYNRPSGTFTITGTSDEARVTVGAAGPGAFPSVIETGGAAFVIDLDEEENPDNTVAVTDRNRRPSLWPPMPSWTRGPAMPAAHCDPAARPARSDSRPPRSRSRRVRHCWLPIPISWPATSPSAHATTSACPTSASRRSPKPSRRPSTGARPRSPSRRAPPFTATRWC